MNFKQTLIEAAVIILCVLGGLFIYHNIIDKQRSFPHSDHQNDSLQNEINKREVKIGILNYRDSLLQADYENKLNELKGIEPKFIQKIRSIHQMTPSQIDTKYRLEVNDQNSEIGVIK